MTAFAAARAWGLGATLFAALTTVYAQSYPVTATQRSTAQQVAQRGIPEADLAANAPAVHQLQHDASAGGMHRVGHLFPARDLGRGVDAGLVPEGGVALHRHRRLGDQQAGAGALGVVGGHQFARHMAGFGAAARERGHQDAVGQGELAGLQRGEEIGHGLLSSGSIGSKSRA